MDLKTVARRDPRYRAAVHGRRTLAPGPGPALPPLAPAPPALAVDGPAILADLNAQRAALGMASVAWDSGIEQACAEHDHYMALNGMQHGEDPAKPGYSQLYSTGGYGPEGHGGGEVISQG